MSGRVRHGVALGLAALLFGTPTRAGWTAPSGTAGAPVDLTVADAGHLAVITTAGAYEIVGNGVGRTLATATPSLRSGFIDQTGCFGVIDNSGYLGSIGCSRYGLQINELNVDVQRLRISEGGYAWACSRDDLNGNHYAYSAMGGTSSWAPATTPFPVLACGAPLSVLSAPSGEYALFTLAAFPYLALYKNGALEALGTDAGVGTPLLAVQLVGGGGIPLRAFAVDSSGSLETAAIDGGVQPFEAIPLPAGVARFQAVALHHSDTERFGMALAELTDGGLRVFSAVPDPAAPSFGRVWRESTAPPASVAGTWKEVQCLGAAACGATTTASGAGSVLSYVNASAPSTPSVSPPIAPIAAGSSVLLPVTVADPDGDAVWVTSQQTAPSSPLLDIVAVEDGAGTSLKITAPSGPICGGDVPITLQVKAEDGRAGHVSAPAQLAITLAGTAPSVGQVSGGPLLASCQVVAGAPVVLAAADLIRTAAPDACPSDTIQWSQISGPPALAGTVTGDVASLRAQGAEWDDLVGREVQLQLVASSGSAIASPVAHAVSIAPQQPFVRATLSSEMPIVSESGVVGISLTLMNESGCGVRGATAAASLEGGQVLPGTVRLDGAPVSAEVTPEGIRLTSVPLAPGVPRVIRFDVRPALVGSPAPRAVATMGGVPISAEAGLGTRPEPGRCGCTSGGETLAGWGALLAVALHRRRRVVTPRCRTSP